MRLQRLALLWQLVLFLTCKISQDEQVCVIRVWSLGAYYYSWHEAIIDYYEYCCEHEAGHTKLAVGVLVQ